jgi:hypothetical protein
MSADDEGPHGWNGRAELRDGYELLMRYTCIRLTRLCIYEDNAMKIPMRA